MNITKLLNKVYFAPRLKEIELYTEHAGELLLPSIWESIPKAVFFPEKD